MKNNNMTRNLGEGNISKLLASLAIPRSCGTGC